MRAVISQLEFLLGGLSGYLPFFTLLELLFAIWLAALGGGVWLYGKMLAPFLVKNEEDIDKGLMELTRSVSTRASSLADSLRTQVAGALINMVLKDKKPPSDATE